MRSWIALPLAFTLAATGCAGGDAEEEMTEMAPDSMAMAQEAFDPAAFDTITWESQAAAEERGAVVYQYSCRKCHGETGLGDAGFVMQGDTLRPPSFRDPDWAYGADKTALMEKIFVGTEVGMPHWGLAGLGAKDIDAVATYIRGAFRGG
jgi:mono/diheme cytochrome c family protein